MTTDKTQNVIGNNFIDIENSFIYQMELKWKFYEITDNPLNFPKFYTLGPRVIGLGQKALKTFESFSKSVLTLKLSRSTPKPLGKIENPFNYC